MALAELIARLEQDTEARLRSMREAADREVQALEAEAARAEAVVTQAHLAVARSTLEATLSRALAEERRRLRNVELTAQHAMLARVLERARALSAEDTAYLSHVARRCDEVLRYFEGLSPVVRCRAEVAAKLSVPVRIDPDVGPGFIVEAADGSVVVDDTHLTRLETFARNATSRDLEPREEGAQP